MNEPRGNGWQKSAMGAMWVVLVMLVGWIYADAASARGDQQKAITALSERVAIQEEAIRNVRESLQRIEAGVNELRHERVK